MREMPEERLHVLAEKLSMRINIFFYYSKGCFPYVKTVFFFIKCIELIEMFCVLWEERYDEEKTGEKIYT